MKRILLTGATGFIGRQCLAAVMRRGHAVHATSSRAPTADAAGVTWHPVDLFDVAGAKALFHDVAPTHWLHLAWHVPPGEFWTSPENTRWVETSKRLLDEFIEAGGQRAVMAGTCAEYEWSGAMCDERVTPLRPATFYGSCKLELAEWIEQRAAAAGIQSAWGRVFYVYGPHEHRLRFVPAMIRSALTGSPIECRTPAAVRDLMYVEDLGDAFAALLDSDVCGAVNLSTGRGIALGEVVQRIEQTAGQMISREDHAGDVSDVVIGNNARLVNEVGWQPAFDLDAGLRRTLEWWQSQLLMERNA